MKIVIVCCLLAICAGCGAPITKENPFGISDPNAVQAWIATAVSAGQASQALGVATGNPAMIGYGAILVVLGGWITNNILKKGKDNGTT